MGYIVCMFEQVCGARAGNEGWGVGPLVNKGTGPCVVPQMGIVYSRQTDMTKSITFPHCGSGGNECTLQRVLKERTSLTTNNKYQLNHNLFLP